MAETEVLTGHVDYDTLPETVKAIYPKSKVASAWRTSKGDLLITTTYDEDYDRWREIAGKWQFVR